MKTGNFNMGKKIKILKNTVVKLDAKGYGITKPDEINEKKYKVWNAIPGEEVEFEVIKKKKREGKAIRIIKASDKRLEPVEPYHFLSCSPWQIFDFSYENNQKIEIFKDLLNEFEISYSNSIQISNDEKSQYNYRNKMEYSFYGDDDEVIHLAFHVRGTSRGKIIIQGCELAEKVINENAIKILKWINKLNVTARDLKTVILRSNGEGGCVAGLFVKEKEKFLKLDIDLIPDNLSIYYSDPLSPASKPTELLHQKGSSNLTTTIKETSLKFGLNSFFQVNIPIFKSCLDDISNFIESEDEVLDFYSGVGSIGLPLASSVKNMKLVEVNSEAVEFAKDNISENNIKNAEVFLSESEKITDIISSENVLIIDPPREGLHKVVIKTINTIKPRKLIYLSCNLRTQLQNISEIIENYNIDFIKLYNFFPRTPHTESLIVLSKK